MMPSLLRIYQILWEPVVNTTSMMYDAAIFVQNCLEEDAWR